MDASRLRVAVLVSGSGTNLQALLDRARRPDAAYEVTVVISDRPGVLGLRRAAAAGVPAVVVDWKEHASRAAFTDEICRVAADHGVGALVLAGFMRILAPGATERYPDRIINVHPALLPAFPGAHAVAQAIAYGVKLSGATVHFVDEEVDHGPIIAQEAVPVDPGDGEAELHARIQAVEHRLLPDVVQAFAEGKITVEGRIVRWEK